MMARPSKYKPEFAGMAESHCELGATNEDLAALFDVAVSTVDKWISEKEEFSGAVKRGRTTADRRIVESLHGRALGGIVETEVVKTVRNADGSTEAVSVPTRVYIPPDTTAAIFWLKNRRAADWRDARQVDGNIHHTHEQVANDAKTFASRIFAQYAAEGAGEVSGKPH